MAEKKKTTKKTTKPKNEETLNPFIKLVPSGGGRPRKELTELGMEQVVKLAGLMATDEEIAEGLSNAHCRISVDTLTNEQNRETFADLKKRGKANGKMSLRAWQFASAKRGNVTMQIFLGKNYLGQTDKVENEVSGMDRNITVNVCPATPDDIEDNEE